jgi:hypothetical protein
MNIFKIPGFWYNNLGVGVRGKARAHGKGMGRVPVVNHS